MLEEISGITIRDGKVIVHQRREGYCSRVLGVITSSDTAKKAIVQERRNNHMHQRCKGNYWREGVTVLDGKVNIVREKGFCLAMD